MDLENGRHSTPDTQETVVQDTPQTNTETPVEQSTEPQQSQETQETPSVSSGDKVSDALAAFDRAKVAASVGDYSPPAAPTTPPQADQTSRPRSFEGLNEEEVKIFKHMPNAAYNFLYPQYLESKKLREDFTKSQEDLKKLQASSFIDHEDAYKLTPEYSNITSAMDRVSQEGEYWQAQLAAVEAGEQFQDLLYDEKTGKYSTSAPIDASPKAKAYLIDKITQSHSLRSQIQSELVNFQSKFRTDHTGYINSLKEAREKVLKNVKPELRKALEKAAASKLDLWPLQMRQRPEVLLAAELLVVNEGLTQMLIEKEGQLSGKSIVNRTAKTAGPASIPGSAPVAGHSVASALDEFRKAGFSH